MTDPASPTPQPNSRDLDEYFDRAAASPEPLAGHDLPEVEGSRAAELAAILMELGDLTGAQRLLGHPDAQTDHETVVRVLLANLDVVNARDHLNGVSRDEAPYAYALVDFALGAPGGIPPTYRPRHRSSADEMQGRLSALEALTRVSTVARTASDDETDETHASLDSPHSSADDSAGGMASDFTPTTESEVPPEVVEPLAIPSGPLGDAYRVAEELRTTHPGLWRGHEVTARLALSISSAARESRRFDEVEPWAARSVEVIEIAVERFPEVRRLALTEFEAEAAHVRSQRRRLSRTKYRDELETLSVEMSEWRAGVPWCPEAIGLSIGLCMEVATMYYIRGQMRHAATLTAPNLELFHYVESQVPGCAWIADIDRTFLSTPPKGIFGSMLRRRTAATETK